MSRLVECGGEDVEAGAAPWKRKSQMMEEFVVVADEMERLVPGATVKGAGIGSAPMQHWTLPDGQIVFTYAQLRGKGPLEVREIVRDSVARLNKAREVING